MLMLNLATMLMLHARTPMRTSQSLTSTEQSLYITPLRNLQHAILQPSRQLRTNLLVRLVEHLVTMTPTVSRHTTHTRNRRSPTMRTGFQQSTKVGTLMAVQTIPLRLRNARH